MTNAQKWVAAVLILFIALFLLDKFTGNDEELIDGVEFYGDNGTGETQNTGDKPQSTDGLTLINNNGCISCHGADLQGTNLAPSLYNADEYWDRAGLINYLRNPNDFSGDDRFEAYKDKYNVIMPAYGNIDVKDLGKMADYILNLKEE